MYRHRLAFSLLSLVAIVMFALPPIANAQPSLAPFAGRWIDVNLTTLRATAYEGDRPVFVAPITSGKPGWETVTGTYYVRSRVYSETMDSLTIGVPHDAPEGYLLKNVLYTQYFTGEGDAIHSNYWQPEWVFGKANTSHGCVGMLTKDAAFFWEFATIGTPLVLHRGNAGAEVPAVVGKPVAEAKAILEQAGFGVLVSEVESDKPGGTVLSQLPGAGAVATKGSPIALTVAKGQPPAPTATPGGSVTATPASTPAATPVATTAPATPVPTTAPAATATPVPTSPPSQPTAAPAGVRKPEGNRAWVPSVVGLAEGEARRRIEEAGLSNTYTNYQVENDIPEPYRPAFRASPVGSVISVSPGAGSEVLKGTVVRLAVRKQ